MSTVNWVLSHLGCATSNACSLFFSSFPSRSSTLNFSLQTNMYLTIYWRTPVWHFPSNFLWVVDRHYFFFLEMLVTNAQISFNKFMMLSHPTILEFEEWFWLDISTRVDECCAHFMWDLKKSVLVTRIIFTATWTMVNKVQKLSQM